MKRPDEACIKALNLLPQDMELWDTPFTRMPKGMGAQAIHLADRVRDYYDVVEEAERHADKEKKAEESKSRFADSKAAQ